MTDRLDPERVRLTLQHVARYRLTTPEAVRTVPALRLKTNANALAWLHRLVADGRLGEAPLDHHGSYFHLTERGARDVRRKPHRGSRHAGPLSESAKARAFALLAFCRLSGINRERYGPTNSERSYPVSIPSVRLRRIARNAPTTAANSDSCASMPAASAAGIEFSPRWPPTCGVSPPNPP